MVKLTLIAFGKWNCTKIILVCRGIALLLAIRGIVRCRCWFPCAGRFTASCSTTFSNVGSNLHYYSIHRIRYFSQKVIFVVFCSFDSLHNSQRLLMAAINSEQMMGISLLHNLVYVYVVRLPQLAHMHTYGRLDHVVGRRRRQSRTQKIYAHTQTPHTFATHTGRVVRGDLWAKPIDSGCSFGRMRFLLFCLVALAMCYTTAMCFRQFTGSTPNDCQWDDDGPIGSKCKMIQRANDLEPPERMWMWNKRKSKSTTGQDDFLVVPTDDLQCKHVVFGGYDRDMQSIRRIYD